MEMVALVDSIDTANRRRPWLLLAGAAVAVLALAAGLASFLARAPGLAADAVNGSYRSDCCGTIVLRDGEMIANERRWAHYVVQEDELGPFVLPDRWVGAFDHGIALDGSRPVEKIRVDALPHPGRIEIPGVRGPIAFVRREPRRPLLPGGN